MTLHPGIHTHTHTHTHIRTRRNLLEADTILVGRMTREHLQLSNKLNLFISIQSRDTQNDTHTHTHNRSHTLALSHTHTHIHSVQKI